MRRLESNAQNLRQSSRSPRPCDGWRLASVDAFPTHGRRVSTGEGVMNLGSARIGTFTSPVVSSQIAREVRAPEGLSVDPSNWRLFTTTDAHALLIGDGLAVWRVLTSVWSTLRKPRFWCESRRLALTLPIYRAGTLILQNVNELEIQNQERLLEWHNQVDRRLRIIATAPDKLELLVQNGVFIRPLYDQLKPV